LTIKWTHRHRFALSFHSYPLLQSYRFAINVFLIRTSHPSGSRLLYYYISPWSVSGPQKTIGSMPCPIIMSQILWLLTNPMKAHDIGESDSNKTKQYLYICGCSSFQSNLMDFHQPLYRFAAAAVFMIETVSPYQMAPDHA